MDLSTGTIGWHRTRQWLDEEIERVSERYMDDWAEGYRVGHRIALMKVRARFNTPEEDVAAKQMRREMFG